MEKKKILQNLIEQLEDGEKQSLIEHISWQYGRKEKKGILRDEIRSEVFEIIQLLFIDSTFKVEETHSFSDLYMDAISVTALSEAVEARFELKGIDFIQITEWQRVSDVINYVDNALECALHDKETHISSFEIEA